MFELIEEAFDQVAFAVEREIARSRGLAVGLGRNDRSDPAVCEGIDEGVGVVSLVADQGLWIGLLEQRRRTSEIVGLPRCEPHIDGIAEGIDQNVDFGGQSAARSADRLLAVFFRAPALY